MDDKARIQELKKKLALAQERVKRTESKGSRGGRGRKGKSVSSALEIWSMTWLKQTFSRR